MQIEVRFSTHGSSYAISGTVIAWSTTVEHFMCDDKAIPFAVPCVILREGQTIRVLPLKIEMYDVEIVIIKDDPEKRNESVSS